jgi:hypothetical protein
MIAAPSGECLQQRPTSRQSRANRLMGPMQQTKLNLRRIPERTVGWSLGGQPDHPQIMVPGHSTCCQQSKQMSDVANSMQILDCEACAGITGAVN